MAEQEAARGARGPSHDVLVIGPPAPDTDELVQALTERGLRAARLEQPEGVARAIGAGRPDAVVVDLRKGDPVANGMVRWLYRKGGGNALVITELHEVDARLQVLTFGVIEHLIAPFEMREATARVTHLMARNRANRRPRIDAGDLALDVGQRTVERAGEIVTLTPREVDVLRALIDHAGEPLSKSSLLSKVWGGGDRSENVVEANVSSLRRKLHALGPPVIHTVHRSGYVFRPATVGTRPVDVTVISQNH
jgi:DNA-binding response OmpR family regulator